MPHAALIVLALLAVPAMALHGLQVNVLAAFQRPRLASIAGLSGTALAALGAVIGMVLAGLHGLYAGNLLGIMAMAGVILVVLHKRFGLPLPGQRGPGWGEWRNHLDVLRFCGLTYVISVGQPLAALAVRYAVLRSTGLAELGLFQSAYVLAGYMGLVLGQSNAYYLTPLMNRDVPPDRKTSSATEFLRHLALCTAAVALPVVLFPRVFVTALFSDAFAAAAPYVVLFVAGQAVLTLAGVLQALLIGLDDLRTHLVVSMGSQAVLATAAWVLSPAFGIWGVVAAFMAADCLLFVACLVRLTTRHRTRLPVRASTSVLYGLCLIAAAGWLGQALSRGGEGVGAKLLVGVAGGASLLVFLTRDEWASLEALPSYFLKARRR